MATDFVTLATSGNISLATVKIVFRRKWEYHVFNTFLQTLILVVSGYITFFFDIDDFSNRVMIVLTAVLVVATIISSVQAVRQKAYIDKCQCYTLLLPST